MTNIKKNIMYDIRDAFFDELYDIASKDSDVILLTADMGAFSLEKFKKNLNSQYINVGVSEQNMVGIAAGLALEGKNVFIYGIAPFVTMRCYEQIKVDISYMNLPVKIIGSGVGIVYGSDGNTHHAVQDISIIRALPGMTIFNASDPISMNAIAKLSYESSNPVYIRLDKGKLPCLYDNDNDNNNLDFSDGMCQLRKGKDLLIIATGVMIHQALKLAELLFVNKIDVSVIDIYRIKPINEKLLLFFIDQSDKIVTLEEHSIIGGIGSIIAELLVDNEKYIPTKRFAIADKYCRRYGNREWMHSFFGLDIDNVYREILEWYNDRR